MTNGFPYEIRVQVRLEQKWRCLECGRRCRSSSPRAIKRRKNFTLDHIVPKSEGGPSTRENARGLCRRCHDKHHGIEPRKKQKKMIILGIFRRAS